MKRYLNQNVLIIQMAKKIDRFDFNKDLDKYVGKVSRSNSRFMNLNEFIKKDNNSKKDSTISDDYDEDHKTELIELKEKKGFSLFISNFLNFFSSKKGEKEETDEIDESDELLEEDYSEDVTEEFQEDLDEEPQDEVTEKKPSFFSRLFGAKEEDNKNEDILKELNEHLLKDLKSVSLFAKELLEKISDKELNQLKKSNKIDNFKEILKRNGLLKK